MSSPWYSILHIPANKMSDIKLYMTSIAEIHKMWVSTTTQIQLIFVL